jgi:hypothetical protein
VAATRNLLTADEWMRTGDLGLIRQDGRVVVIDRLKVSCIRFPSRVTYSDLRSFGAKQFPGSDQSKGMPRFCNRARGYYHKESERQRGRCYWSCCVSRISHSQGLRRVWKSTRIASLIVFDAGTTTKAHERTWSAPKEQRYKKTTSRISLQNAFRPPSACQEASSSCPSCRCPRSARICSFLS